MDVAALLLTSAVVSAIVGGLVTYATQRQLLSRKAQVDYEYNAKKRVYEAVGPLRLQLLLAAQDLVDRSAPHHLDKWDMRPGEYYVKSFVYRLLRPLSICQLVEQQMSIADFAVDATTLELLKFNATSYRMLAGDEVVRDHPSVDWSTQSQHVYRENLESAAARLIVATDDKPACVMGYLEFSREIADPLKDPDIHDLAALFARCESSLLENPVFWLRVVGYAYACSHLIASQGTSLGFEPRSLSVTGMIAAVDDEHIRSRANEFVGIFDSVLRRGL